MDYITTTNLRTQSSKLVNALQNGHSISLIHRSKIVGIIQAKNEPKPITKSDIQELEHLAEEMDLPKTSYAERERKYRKHIMSKYDKGLS